MVYTSEHPALAALEILNGWEAYSTLSGYHLYCCLFDETLVLEARSDLDVRDKSATRNYGDAWITNRDSVVLKVSSVAIPASYNYLINPNHPDFLPRVKTEHYGLFAFDERVEKLVREANRDKRPNSRSA
jgi:RES domain-containing protein